MARRTAEIVVSFRDLFQKTGKLLLFACVQGRDDPRLRRFDRSARGVQERLPFLLQRHDFGAPVPLGSTPVDQPAEFKRAYDCRRRRPVERSRPAKRRLVERPLFRKGRQGDELQGRQIEGAAFIQENSDSDLMASSQQMPRHLEYRSRRR